MKEGVRTCQGGSADSPGMMYFLLSSIYQLQILRETCLSKPCCQMACQKALIKPKRCEGCPTLYFIQFCLFLPCRSQAWGSRAHRSARACVSPEHAKARPIWGSHLLPAASMEANDLTQPGNVLQADDGLKSFAAAHQASWKASTAALEKGDMHSSCLPGVDHNQSGAEILLQFPPPAELAVLSGIPPARAECQIEQAAAVNGIGEEAIPTTVESPGFRASLRRDGAALGMCEGSPSAISKDPGQGGIEELGGYGSGEASGLRIDEATDKVVHQLPAAPTNRCTDKPLQALMRTVARVGIKSSSGLLHTSNIQRRWRSDKQPKCPPDSRSLPGVIASSVEFLGLEAEPKGMEAETEGRGKPDASVVSKVDFMPIAQEIDASLEEKAVKGPKVEARQIATRAAKAESIALGKDPSAGQGERSAKGASPEAEEIAKPAAPLEDPMVEAKPNAASVPIVARNSAADLVQRASLQPTPVAAAEESKPLPSAVASVEELAPLLSCLPSSDPAPAALSSLKLEVVTGESAGQLTSSPTLELGQQGTQPFISPQDGNGKLYLKCHPVIGMPSCPFLCIGCLLAINAHVLKLASRNSSSVPNT
jgi:hypothetical protein